MIHFKSLAAILAGLGCVAVFLGFSFYLHGLVATYAIAWFALVNRSLFG